MQITTHNNRRTRVWIVTVCAALATILGTYVSAQSISVAQARVATDDNGTDTTTTPVTSRNETELTGVVTAITDTTITVNGKTIVISQATEVKGSIKVGASVKVHVFTGSDGTLTAREIESSAPVATPNATPGATPVTTPVADDHGNDGANHDVNDDHGNDGANHDVNDDHGNDSANHDVNDDHGNDGANHDANDDHGGSNSSTGSDDKGGKNKGSGDDKGGKNKGGDDKGGKNKGGNDKGGGHK